MIATAEKVALPLAGWHSWRWSGTVLVGTSPEGRQVSLGEIVDQQGQITIEVLTPDGEDLDSRPVFSLRDAQRTARLIVLGSGGIWPEPPEDMSESIWCRRRRKELRLTQEQLAIRVREATGIACGMHHVSCFERGVSSGQLDLELLERVLGPFAPEPAGPLVVTPTVTGAEHMCGMDQEPSRSPSVGERPGLPGGQAGATSPPPSRLVEGGDTPPAGDRYWLELVSLLDRLGVPAAPAPYGLGWRVGYAEGMLRGRS